MANKLDPMDLKQIITLHLDGVSNRKIEKTIGISRNTINTYIKLFKSCEYSLKELVSFDNLKLRELFPGNSTIKNERYDELMLHFENGKRCTPSSRLYLPISLQ
ncbi:helix-turn-helix domain-containing protein [Carboxylicivirga marina]|uniref:Helix-turn-helix domain-containing protein n=1 Tax=Carboxylicivirga marina TaxID=2800988 RepID=A0ABS1HKS9_9BACT|nr:helix-turn-helix domain-containing protein [Carboxylicivirga marina]MBK3518275.1 helix-turn-helix domain-containing protein [Carboxylicivirga marina]